jgi:hypothetical protein
MNDFQAHLAFQNYLRRYGCSMALRSPFRATKPTADAAPLSPTGSGSTAVDKAARKLFE